VVWSPQGLAFGMQAVGTTSAPRTLTLTNQNTAAILMGPITATVDYIVSANNCPATLGPGKNCTVEVEFAPTQTGPMPGTLYVSDSDPNSPQEPPLSGTGK
jgi:hypothetical protein